MVGCGQEQQAERSSSERRWMADCNARVASEMLMSKAEFGDAGVLLSWDLRKLGLT